MQTIDQYIKENWLDVDVDAAIGTKILEFGCKLEELDSDHFIYLLSLIDIGEVMTEIMKNEIVSQRAVMEMKYLLVMELRTDLSDRIDTIKNGFDDEQELESSLIDADNARAANNAWNWAIKNGL